MLWMNRRTQRDLWFALLLVLVVFGGCSDPDAPVAPAAPKTCPAGELLLEDGRCQPAGLPPDMACPPGEWEMAGGMRAGGVAAGYGVPAGGGGEGGGRMRARGDSAGDVRRGIRTGRRSRL